MHSETQEVSNELLLANAESALKAAETSGPKSISGDRSEQLVAALTELYRVYYYLPIILIASRKAKEEAKPAQIKGALKVIDMLKWFIKVFEGIAERDAVIGFKSFLEDLDTPEVEAYIEELRRMR